MIAHPGSRRKGIGQEAVTLMMEYGKYFLHVSQYIVKIGAANDISLALFKKIGFTEWEHIEVLDLTFSPFFHPALILIISIVFFFSFPSGI
jgi:RimJ/RimL family protein N-acetyltransferase